MKKLLLVLLFVPLVSFGQYSMYYGTVDVNQNISGTVNINKNVNVSGTVNKTIETIDYGALAAANAARERNRIESSKIANENERQALVAIANDPSKAFDYGTDNNWKPSKKYMKESENGYKKYTFYHKIPHQSLFTRVRNGYNYQNISDNGIETLIEVGGQRRLGFNKEKYPFFIEIEEVGLEKALKKFYTGWRGQKTSNWGLNDAFVHNNEMNRARVFGISGYVVTAIAEDDYEYVIVDNYYSKSGDIFAWSTVTFRGDKDKISFEDLEGRRFYFQKLIAKTLGSASYKNTKNAK